MKRLYSLCLALALAMLAACGGNAGAQQTSAPATAPSGPEGEASSREIPEPTFGEMDIAVTDNGALITGSAERADADSHCVFAYLKGGAAEGLQLGRVGDPRFKLGEDGGFEVEVTNPASSVTLYLAPRDADYSDKNALEKAAFAQEEIVIPRLSESDPKAAPEPEPDPEPDPEPQPEPETVYSFILFKDDGAERDSFGELAYMGMDDDGNDGSMTADLFDTSEKTVGESSSRFTYTPPGGSHWAGMMFLFEPGKFQEDPKDKGPDLSKATKMTFYVKGGAETGTVKFFVECDGGPQSSETVALTGEWAEVTLPLDKDWSYCNVPFGWACNQSDPDGVSLQFWVDGIRFE
jgi:hypothetical protein